MERSTGYVIGFAAAVCLVCAIFVAGSAVSLKERQAENVILDRQKKVLIVAGLIENGASPSAETIRNLFQTNIKGRIVDLKTGKYGPDNDTFDQRKASTDPTLSEAVPANPAQVQRVPNQAMVYHKIKNGKIDRIILPIEGKGLWSTLYGYLALAPDTNTVKGIIFYEHAETPGLGGEIENPLWTGLWPGKKIFDVDQNGSVTKKLKIEVKKGLATPGDEYGIDGLSGATITARGVTHLVHFWMGDRGFGPYLDEYRAGGDS